MKPNVCVRVRSATGSLFRGPVGQGIILRAVIFTLLCGVGIGTLQMTAQSAVPFRLKEKPGSFGVGLKVVEQYDYSRVFQPLVDTLGQPFQGERARPLQTLVWYPAQASSAKPMIFSDYIALKATETSFGRPKKLIGMEERHISGMRPSYTTAMWAVRDAPLAPGRFPVIIYAPSFSSVSWENADLCEYLASFGYVVIAAPGMGVGRESTHDVAGTNAQAQDISFLIGYAQTLADTDSSKVAVIGFSWGGLANLFAASRDNRINGLVALDGSLRYFPGVVKQAGDVHPEQMTIPLLFFKGQHSLEDEDRLEQAFNSAGPSVLNEWVHGDLISVQMLGLIHPEFSSTVQRNELLWRDEFPHLQESDYGREDESIGYAWVARYTREFLDAYLKGSSSSSTFLKNTPMENGVPLHVMAVEYHPAQSMPASFTSFRTEVGHKGFDHASEIYEALRKEQPSFVLEPDAVTSWAYELLAEGHLSEALDIIKFAVQLNPSSHNYASLGEMYADANQKQAAIDSYKKALEKNPNDLAAKQGLERLESPASLQH